MIQINLLPGARKKKAVSVKSIDIAAVSANVSDRLRDKFMIGAIVAVLVGAGAAALLFFTQSKRAETLSVRQEAGVRDSTHYANFLKDRYRAESVRDTLLREMNVIRSLDEDRFVWPHVLDEVDRALPQFTWLTSVAFTGTPQGSNNVVVAPKSDDTSSAKRKRPKRLDTNIPRDDITVRIMGRTVDIQALTRFMTDLEASPFFNNVQLDKSELAVEEGKEVTQFQLTLGYTRPDTLLLHRVPLSLSVR